MDNLQELQLDLMARQLRELERSNPKKARKQLYSNPNLLEIRKQAALAALQRKV